MRDYRPLAESINRKSWSDLPAPSSALEAACRPAFEEKAHRSQERYLHARRNRLADRIRAGVEYPRPYFYRSEYFRCLPTLQVLSTAEAVDDLRRALRCELNRKGHWSYKPDRIELIREGLVFARWFRRFGQRAWMAAHKRQAA